MRKCKENGCENRVGVEHRKCPGHRGSAVSETTDYDPRFERAQTVGGAKARYADHGGDYTLSDLERDVERLLETGEYPDAVETPQFAGQVVFS